MATTEHATNEQMAEIMGWKITYDDYVDEDTGERVIEPVYLVPPDKQRRWDFNPIADLNHAALVEARIAELGLNQEYMSIIASILRMEDKGFSYWRMFTASAQTRCDAAWAMWQQYQELGK